jgi:S-adenosylmethionine:tRNA ribosyltransferase-isomerase
MNGNMMLSGLRFRGEEAARVEARLLVRVAPDRWRAIVWPAERIRPGDRLRFGESSESAACLLGFLDADVISIDGEDALLAFAFCGPALDDALERLGCGQNRGG